jgi:hypothetical protein
MFLFLAGVMVLAPGCPAGGGGLYGGGNNGGNDNGGDGGPGVEVTFSATLSGDQEAPPVESNGAGSGTFTLNAEGTELSYEVTASGLSGPVTYAHFHNSPPGISGGIVFEITNTITENADGTITASGVWPTDNADVSALLDGDIYINFHTADHPDGEIRGQLIEEE